jgi:hypothetical protein
MDSTRLSKHAILRMSERRVTPQQVRFVLETGDRRPGGRGSGTAMTVARVGRRRITVVTNARNGHVLTILVDD